MNEKTLEVMIGKIDERSIRTFDLIEKMDKRMDSIERRLHALESRECNKHDVVVKDIYDLKVNQEKLQSNSDLGDAKLMGLININTARTTTLSTALVLIVQYIFNHLK